jgi:hypothetical protein
LFGDRPVAGPDALLRNGMRMPPGMVVSHEYLVADSESGEWFVDVFPTARDEASVRERHRLFVDQAKHGPSVWVLATEDGLLALPAHEEDRPVSLVFGSAALARAFAERAGFDVTPEEIPVDELVNEYLPAKLESGSLVGTNWTPDLVGVEIEPHVLIDALVAYTGA